MTAAANEINTQLLGETVCWQTETLHPVSESISFSPTLNQIESYVFAITGGACEARPVIKEENLTFNQCRELALAAEVTLKTVQYFLNDYPDPFSAPAIELTQLSNYLNAGMSLPYAARVDIGAFNNYSSPQPDVIFPPRRGGSYKLERGKLMIADTQGGYVALTTVIAALRNA